MSDTIMVDLDVTRLMDGIPVEQIIGKPFRADDGSIIGYIENAVVEDEKITAVVKVQMPMVLAKIIAEGSKNISYEIRNI